MIYHLKNFLKISIVIFLCSCSGDKPMEKGPIVGLSNNTNLDQILGALISYTVMSELCGDREMFSLLKIESVKALEFGKSNNMLAQNGEVYYYNLNEMLTMLVEEVNNKTYVTCGETEKNSDSLLETVTHPEFYIKLITKE
jgi:hypothetical protein